MVCIPVLVVIRGINPENTGRSGHRDPTSKAGASPPRDKSSPAVDIWTQIPTGEETQDALVNVEDGWVQAFSSIKIEDGREESLIGNSCIESGPGHQQYQGSGESEIVRCKKRTKADSSAHGDEDTSGVSGIAKKSKKDKTGTGNSE
ncbi:hypothetical protein CBL_20052 [Carabus blaptoides fortunei]